MSLNLHIPPAYILMDHCSRPLTYCVCNMQHTLLLSLEEMYHGCTKKVSHDRTVVKDGVSTTEHREHVIHVSTAKYGSFANYAMDASLHGRTSLLKLLDTGSPACTSCLLSQRQSSKHLLAVACPTP